MVNKITLHDTFTPPVITKEVSVTLVRIGSNFVVKSINNSTWWIPGDHVTRETAEKACQTPNWNVYIVDNDMVQAVIGAIVGRVTRIVQ